MPKEKTEKRRVKKINPWIVFTVIILIFLAVLIYGYVSKNFEQQKKNAELIQYKKGFYKSVLCEYSCPLKMQLVQNKTQLLPEAKCVKNCTEIFKSENKNQNYTSAEIDNDKLASGILNVIVSCRTQSMNSTQAINNSAFFQCASKELPSLKGNYSYLDE